MAPPPESDSKEARLEGLVRDYARLVRHAIRTIGGQRITPIAEDIEQNVFLAIWNQVRREQTITHPLSYIYQVAVRETVRAVRQRDAQREVASGEPWGELTAAPQADPEQATLAAEHRAQLEDALHAMATDRARAVRAHLQGFTVEEIMALYRWDYQRARNLIARGMSDLRLALRERGGR